MAPSNISDALSLTFGALADPTRRTILARLAEGDAAVNELAALTPTISLQAVSKHLQVLERAGLVTRGRTSRQRPAHLRAEPIAEVAAWLAHYRVFWEDSLDRLGEHLSRLQGAEAEEGPEVGRILSDGGTRVRPHLPRAPSACVERVD